jgi:hypothetical protein
VVVSVLPCEGNLAKALPAAINAAACYVKLKINQYLGVNGRELKNRVFIPRFACICTVTVKIPLCNFDKVVF